MSLLVIDNLHAAVGTTPILRGVTATVAAGETVVLLGPNGSGKSTLAGVLLGHPAYTVTAGQLLFAGEDITAAAPEVRAARGLFLAFQYPQSVAGVTLGNFLRLAYNAVHPPLAVREFMPYLKAKLDLLELPRAFAGRAVNEGFSGGEKKRAEMLQLAVLRPRLAILDETDSGLDVDALKIVGRALLTIRQEQPELALLIITHHQHILRYCAPDRVLVMHAGRIVKSGTPDLLPEIEQHGFAPYAQE